MCHDHQDASVFAIVVQVEGADAVTYRLYCYQAEHKVVRTFRVIIYADYY